MITIIELEIPVEKIPYIRTIEGRKFRNGKWLFPESAVKNLQQYGFIDNSYRQDKKKFIKYELSEFLYKYQKEVISKALNNTGYGLFLDTGC